MNIASLFRTRPHPQAAPPAAFPYSRVRCCLTCHLVWDDEISPQCPAGHAASIALGALTQEKNERILRLQQMVKKLLRMVDIKDRIIAGASRVVNEETSAAIDLPPGC